jgi:hypothetical protein
MSPLYKTSNMIEGILIACIFYVVMRLTGFFFEEWPCLVKLERKCIGIFQ